MSSVLDQQHHRPVLPGKPVDRVTTGLSVVAVVLVVWSALGLDADWSRLLSAPAARACNQLPGSTAPVVARARRNSASGNHE